MQIIGMATGKEAELAENKTDVALDGDETPSRREVIRAF